MGYREDFEMGLLMAILAVLKQIPGLLRMASTIEKAINDVQARNRLADKNAAVRDAVGKHRVPVHSPPTEQQREAHGEGGLPPSSEDGS